MHPALSIGKISAPSIEYTSFVCRRNITKTILLREYNFAFLTLVKSMVSHNQLNLCKSTYKLHWKDKLVHLKRRKITQNVVIKSANFTLHTKPSTKQGRRKNRFSRICLGWFCILSYLITTPSHTLFTILPHPRFCNQVWRMWMQKILILFRLCL